MVLLLFLGLLMKIFGVQMLHGLFVHNLGVSPTCIPLKAGTIAPSFQPIRNRDTP